MGARLVPSAIMGRSFGVRVRRLGLDGTWGQTVVETQTGTRDNLKGISVWRDGAGRDDDLGR